MNQEQVIETVSIQRMVGRVANAEGHSAEQIRFFTSDAQINVYMGDEKILEFSGLRYIEHGLKQFMANVKRCHYLLGQNTIDFLTGSKATGRLFCRATHVTENMGEEIITDYCIYYEDIYERHQSEWLIKARDVHYFITDKRVLGI